MRTLTQSKNLSNLLKNASVFIVSSFCIQHKASATEVLRENGKKCKSRGEIENGRDIGRENILCKL